MSPGYSPGSLHVCDVENTQLGFPNPMELAQLANILAINIFTLEHVREKIFPLISSKTRLEMSHLAYL